MFSIIYVKIRKKLESFQDFLIQLDMKPRMHLVEINICLLNNVTYQNYEQHPLAHLKILIFKVIFQC